MENTINNKQLDMVVDAAANSNTNESLDIRDINVETNPDAALDLGVVTDDNLSSEVVSKYHDADVSIFDLSENDVSVAPNNEDIEAAANMMKDGLELSDEDVLQLMEVLRNARDKKYKVFPNLPDKLKTMVMNLVVQNKANPAMAESMARYFIEELMKESNLDNALVDLEKAIDDALNMPSIVDMYSEHTRNVMDTIIPQTIEQIKDEYPDKAERLEGVRNNFYKAYNFEVCVQAYASNSRLRKAVRRYELEFDRVLDKFNYINEKSSFKMNDVHLVPEALRKVLIEDRDSIMADKHPGDEFTKAEANIVLLKATEIDIKKFCILILKYCEGMDANNLFDSVFMYYLTRNIIMLKHSNETKTEFAAELIINICKVIEFIRNKEAEFNESNMDKSKPAKKRSNSRSV